MKCCPSGVRYIKWDPLQHQGFSILRTKDPKSRKESCYWSFVHFCLTHFSSWRNVHEPFKTVPMIYANNCVKICLFRKPSQQLLAWGCDLILGFMLNRNLLTNSKCALTRIKCIIYCTCWGKNDCKLILWFHNIIFSKLISGRRWNWQVEFKFQPSLLHLLSHKYSWKNLYPYRRPHFKLEVWP